MKKPLLIMTALFLATTGAMAGDPTARRPTTTNPTMSFLITPLPPLRCDVDVGTSAAPRCSGQAPAL